MDRLEQVQERLDMYLEAEKAVLKSQSYNIGGQSLTRANLAEIRKGIAECEAILYGGFNKRTVRRIVPIDN